MVSIWVSRWKRRINCLRICVGRTQRSPLHILLDSKVLRYRHQEYSEFGTSDQRSWCFPCFCLSRSSVFIWALHFIATNRCIECSDRKKKPKWETIVHGFSLWKFKWPQILFQLLAVIKFLNDAYRIPSIVSFHVCCVCARERNGTNIDAARRARMVYSLFISIFSYIPFYADESLHHAPHTAYLWPVFAIYSHLTWLPSN